MGRKSSDLTGRTFGLLKVIRYDNDKWICKCNCGSVYELSLSARYLMNGKYHHCGCLSKIREPAISLIELEDLYINKKLSIIEISSNTGLHSRTIAKYLLEYRLKSKKLDILSKKNLYNLFVVKRYSITRISKEYGISRSKVSTYINKYNLMYERIICISKIKPRKTTGRKPSILIGRRYGKLTVESYISNGRNVLCRCDCGKSIEVDVGSLYSYKVSSCGCTYMSIALLRIEEYLTKKGIKYTTSIDNGEDLIFDFALFNDDIPVALIQYVGNSIVNSISTNIYCKKNRIELVKVKYQSKGKIYEILGEVISHLIPAQNDQLQP